MPGDGDGLGAADATPVVMRPLKPGYKATHLDPWPPATKKPAAQTAAEAADVERRQEEGDFKLRDSSRQN